jgi:hypothetical protein
MGYDSRNCIAAHAEMLKRLQIGHQVGNAVGGGDDRAELAFGSKDLRDGAGDLG